MSGSTFRMGEGDWICGDSQCANINFARRTQCNRCGSEKSEALNKRKLGQEIGKAAAAKSHGLFSADDWQCNKCGNVNWARRQQCNVCNAPRFGDVEERTGLGGGYNDRGVVEYKKRDDSDDEYDEFGRRKKKMKKSIESESDYKSNGRRSPTISKKEDQDKKDGKYKRKEKEEEEEDGEDELDDREEEDDEEDGDEDDEDLSKLSRKMNKTQNEPEARYTLNVKRKKPINLPLRKMLFYVGGFIAVVATARFIAGPVLFEMKMREAERYAEFIETTKKREDDEHS